MSTDFRQSTGYQSLLKASRFKVLSLGEREVGVISRKPRFPFMHELVIQGVKNPGSLFAAERTAPRHRCRVIRIAPRIGLESEQARNWSSILRDHGYVWDDEAVIPTRTILLDLSHSEDVLLSHMKKRTRYNIRLAERRGVRVRCRAGNRVGKDESLLDDFIRLHAENCRRLKVRSPDPGMFRNVLDHFGENIVLCLAHSSNGDLGAVASFIVADDTISYQMNASNDVGRHDCAPSLLVWEGMLEGRRRECRWFDFEGVNDARYEADRDWEGFSRFKGGFGGERVSFIGSFRKKVSLHRPRLL